MRVFLVTHLASDLVALSDVFQILRLIVGVEEPHVALQVPLARAKKIALRASVVPLIAITLLLFFLICYDLLLNHLSRYLGKDLFPLYRDLKSPGLWLDPRDVHWKQRLCRLEH